MTAAEHLRQEADDALPGTVSFSALVGFLAALHQPGEWFTVSTEGSSRPFSSVAFDDPEAAADYIGGLPAGLNVWHGVNSLGGRPNRGRGAAADVSRLGALWADLDVKPGALHSTEAAWHVVESLAERLAAAPTFVVGTGSGGLHPYWLLDFDPRLDLQSAEARSAANRMLAGWFREVSSVCVERGAAATDNVYDLSRILRTPGTVNVKPSVMAPVTLWSSAPERVSVDHLTKRLNLDTPASHTSAPVDVPARLSAGAEERHPAASWPTASATCPYARRLLDGIASDKIALGRSRHNWAADRLLRLWCAVRSGCVSPGDVVSMVNAVQERLDLVRQDDGPRPGEAEALSAWTRAKVEGLSDAEVAEELSGHTHSVSQRAAPDDAGYERAVDVRQDEAESGYLLLAGRLAADFGDDLKHVAGLGWYAWDGQRWSQETGEVRALRAVHQVLVDAVYEARADKDEALQGSAFRAMNSVSGAEAVLRWARAMEPFALSAADLDADGYLLNTANGTVDLRSMLMRPHTRSDLLTKVTRGAYRPGERSDAWEAFLRRVMPDDDVRAYLQRFLGLALCGMPLEHTFTVAVGQGANGKGTLRSAYAHALGGYAHEAPATLFLEANRHSGAASPDLIGLRGRRFVVASETDERARLSVALMKQASGGDPITARALYAAPITFAATWTILLVTNHLPGVPGDDEAVWRRMRVLPFTTVIPAEERDGTLGERLEGECDAILTWAIEGWCSYRSRATSGRPQGSLEEPPAVLGATTDYRSACDDIGRFISEECVTGERWRSSATQLYERWLMFCDVEGVRAGSQTEFGRTLTRRGFGSRRTARGTERTGIALRVGGGEPL